MVKNEYKVFVVFCGITTRSEKKNTFSVPLAQLADLNGEMLSFKEQGIFHISSDTLTTLI